MKHREIEGRVMGIIQEVLGVQEVTLDTVLVGRSGVLDSMSALELMVKLENEFQVVFDDDLMIESLSSPHSVILFIESAIGK